MRDTNSMQSVEGRLNETDIKRLTRAMRGGTVGPTALYYAGVTAPVISAAVGLVAKTSFGIVGMTNYWQVFLSAIVAAMAGIVWYLIFMRWSYRHHHGRAEETEQDTQVVLAPDHLRTLRGGVETRIKYEAIREVLVLRSAVLVKFHGADPLIVPDRWFADASTRTNFKDQLDSLVPS
ncbi:MAG: YcxB family protein [Pseudomonadota bacterium]